MGKVFPFHGGIHPPENKHQSTQLPIAKAPLSKVLHIPLQQHIGVAAKACVEVGDKVLKGQCIGDAQGHLSVPIHASSSGTVCAIGEHPVPHPSGMSGLCISIETDGEDRWIEHGALENFRALSELELIDYIRDRGIAGMGGAGFPTALKLQLGDKHIINTLVINAAECEPYITADDLLMRERSTQIVGGIDVLQHLIKPSHVIIGIEDNKPQAFRALKAAIKDCAYNIDVISVPTKYPSGGEKQLIQLLTNVEVPNGGIPADVGIVCQNVGTVYAIYRAVSKGESLISRIVTVTGGGVNKPQNYETLIGTPVSTLLQAAGEIQDRVSKLIIGGPMMGYSITSIEIPLVKTTNCIVAASVNEMPVADPAQACIRCGLCEQVCPAQLLPQQLHWFAKSQEYIKAQQHNLFDCIECGACSYVCPSNIPLVQYYRHAKTSIREEQQEKRKSDLARERFEAKHKREQRAIDEKAAKRKARAEQAAISQAAKKLSENNPSSPVVDDEQQLKNQLNAAKLKLQQAQDHLTKLASSHGSQVSDSALAERQVQHAKSNLAQIEKAVDDFKPQLASAIVDVKKLKIGAALANTKLNKAQQALKKAIEKSQPGVEQLQKTITMLDQEASNASKLYQKALRKNTQAETDTTEVAETKRLKIAVAIALSKLKKAQVQFANEEYSDAASATLFELTKQLEKAEQPLAALQKATAENANSATNKNSVQPPLKTSARATETASPDLKVLKTAAAIARTKLKKAQDQLQTLAPEDQHNSSAVQNLLSEIKSLEEKVRLSQASYVKAKETSDFEPSVIESASVRRTHYNKILALHTKAMAALAKAEADNSPAVTKMRISIDKLSGKLKAATAALSSDSIPTSNKDFT
jgi:electron transport complex protein RnfC